MALVRLQEYFKSFLDPRSTPKTEFVFQTPIMDDSGFFAGSPKSVFVDCTLAETHTLTSNITQNPIESGSYLSDHIHNLPRSISLRGAITSRPLDIVSAIVRTPIRAFVSTTAGLILNPILGGYEKYLSSAATGIISERVFGVDTGGKRSGVGKAYWKNFLTAKFNEKQPFTIRSEVDEVENVFFESLSWERDYKQGEGLIFNCTLKEILIVRSQVLVLPRAPQASQKSFLGTITPEPLHRLGQAATRLSRNVDNILSSNSHTTFKKNVYSAGSSYIKNKISGYARTGYGLLKSGARKVASFFGF